jgi:hypothetical protein
MINLLPREDLLDMRIERIKTYVKTGTTILLAVYLVAVLGIILWWVYLTQNQDQATRQMKEILGQLSNQGNKEALYRNLAHRVSIVDKAVSEHKLVSSRILPLLDTSVGVQITGYSWDDSPRQKLVLKASNPLLLERYIDTLKVSFKKVKLDEFRLYTAPDWTATVIVE